MAPTGRLNGALLAAAPGQGCPGPTRTHPALQRRETGRGETEMGRNRDTGRDKRWERPVRWREMHKRGRTDRRTRRGGGGIEKSGVEGQPA